MPAFSPNQLRLSSFGLVLFVLVVLGCQRTREMKAESQEALLFRRIQNLPPGNERDLLIDELEKTPDNMRLFYATWISIHDDGKFAGWTDDGYDSSLSKSPRDIQLLTATYYGKLDIENGGFHQFFGNTTGVFAPEMVEWFERSGMVESARIVREAINVFGTRFPRSQHERKSFLDKYKVATREEWDPFYEMNEMFYAATKDEAFQTKANHWLRDVCNIKRLRDTPAQTEEDPSP